MSSSDANSFADPRSKAIFAKSWAAAIGANEDEVSIDRYSINGVWQNFRRLAAEERRLSNVVIVVEYTIIVPQSKTITIPDASSSNTTIAAFKQTLASQVKTQAAAAGISVSTPTINNVVAAAIQ